MPSHFKKLYQKGQFPWVSQRVLSGVVRLNKGGARTQMKAGMGSADHRLLSYHTKRDDGSVSTTPNTYAQETLCDGRLKLIRVTMRCIFHHRVPLLSSNF